MVFKALWTNELACTEWMCTEHDSRVFVGFAFGEMVVFEVEGRGVCWGWFGMGLLHMVNNKV